MRQEFRNLEASLKQMVQDLPERPKSVLMISGHWETPVATVMSGETPPMVYDYHGFPPETYDVRYPAPGDPEMAAYVVDLLEGAGIETAWDGTQGYDHGTFVPMHVMYPQADMPLFQLSILKSYDPGAHFAMGRALAPLRDEGVLIVGSGLSYHNLRAFGPTAKKPSQAFDRWLHDTLALPASARTGALVNWEQAPHARDCHAQEDHLVPIFAALGAAEDETATRIYHDRDLFGGVTASGYRFG
jgi:aromatic ring-opening dioxygenase catalytic subunit (LigB family)